MTIAELREKLNCLYEDGAGAVAYFILKIENQLCIRMVDIKNEFLDDLKTCYLNSLTTSIMNTEDARVEELQLLQISVADQRDNALYEYDLEDIPDEFAFFNTIAQDGEQQIFSSNNDSLKDLFGYVIAVGTNQNKALLFKKHFTTSYFSPEKFCIFESDHRFTKLEKPMIRLDTNFEMLYVDGTIVIKKLDTLEKYAGFHDVIKREATVSVQAITEADIVDNAEVLRDMVDEVSFARKLTKTAKGSPVLGKIPTPAIINFVKNHPKLKDKIKLTQDERKLHLDTKESKKQFLKMLNDDYLRSELTQAYYDSLAKDTLTVEEQGGE
ncbi:anti-phage protein KwaB [Succinispira mobilis]|uniref:anti-phage protein KwaB n=1 Tax=Succinispira mobilis TaxID=78120 RepID=UPI00036E0066|nr:anti-phage protein KwaB [Succinispira mobilis]